MGLRNTDSLVSSMQVLAGESSSQDPKPQMHTKSLCGPSYRFLVETGGVVSLFTTISLFIDKVSHLVVTESMCRAIGLSIR